MSFWSEKKVVVTGGAGFLGSYVVDALRDRGCTHVTVPRSADFDLREVSNIERLYEQSQPDIVLHLAAVVGGIGANRAHPGAFFYDNLIMGTQLLEYARRHEISKFVTVGTVCSYPKFTPVPFVETDLWEGYPEETNAPYGVAKKALLVQSQAYREEYGMDAIFLMPTNLYGPRDNFDLETSHVIPAMIRKFDEAKSRSDQEVVLWGDGSPTREFIYAADVADGLLRATEVYEEPEPVNLGSGKEVSIKDLAEAVKTIVGFQGDIRWDTSMPNGQPRRCLSTTRANEKFGFQSRTELSEGLAATYDYYVASLKPTLDQPGVASTD